MVLCSRHSTVHPTVSPDWARVRLTWVGSRSDCTCRVCSQLLLRVGRKRQHRAKGDKGHETCHAIDVGGAFGISSLLPVHEHKPA
jgi:hypothetical protein